MTLLICPVRPGDENNELRYALRSWEKNLILPSRLFLMTVGHKPAWLTPDLHIDGNHYDSVPHNVWDNIRLGSQAAVDYHERFAIYMNDDFFCLDPVLAVPIVKRDVSLAQHIALYPQGSAMWFVRSLRLTASWLSEAGFPHPDSYDLHRPLPASPSSMIQALSRWDKPVEGDLPQWRTLYGVLNNVPALPVQDVKMGTIAKANTHSPWVSTSDSSWRKYGRHIAARFPKPSRWEKQ